MTSDNPSVSIKSVCVGDLVYYRPMHESTLKSSPVIRIIPTLPEPIVCLEDGKMMGLSSVLQDAYLLPAAAQN